MQRLDSVSGYATVLYAEALFMDFVPVVLLLTPFVPFFFLSDDRRRSPRSKYYSNAATFSTNPLLEICMVITLTRRREWPSYNPRGHLLSGKCLLCLCFELVHVPVRPNQSTFQEFGLGTSQPDHEVCRELSYEGKC